jgi:thymidylate synthase
MGKMREFVEMVVNDGCPKGVEFRGDCDCDNDCLKCYMEQAQKLLDEDAQHPEESREINTEGKPLVETAHGDLHLSNPKRGKLRKRIKKVIKRWEGKQPRHYLEADILNRCIKQLKRELDKRELDKR